MYTKSSMSIHNNRGTFIKFLEEQVDVGPVARHPIEALGVQTLLLYEVDGLLEEDGNRVVARRPEVVHGGLRLHRVGLYPQQLVLLLGLLLFPLSPLLLLLQPPLFVFLILLLLLGLRREGRKVRPY